MNLIATGNTAEVFQWGDGKILKLFKEGYPREAVAFEFRNASLVNSLQIASPKAHQVTECNGRWGIVYEQIQGNDLLQEAMLHLDDNLGLEKIMAEFVDFHLDFISHRSRDCISYKDFLSGFGYGQTSSLPDGDFLCHGDFHPGNLMRTQSGGPERILAIDFLNLCHGPREYDIARSYVLITEDSLGKDISASDRERILTVKNAAGKMYLSRMGVSFDDLEPFITAVEFCRKMEMA